MEHLVYKALDPYENEMDMLGISQNAYTSDNEVVFHMKGLDSSLDKWRTKFVDLISNFDVSKEDFEKERNIVLQEYMDSFNEQTSTHYYNLLRKKLGVYNPIGLKEDLEKLTYMDCLNYFETMYMNPTKIINVSKNMEFSTDSNFKVPNIKKVYRMGDYATPLELNNSFNNKVSLIMMSDLVKEDFNYISFVHAMLGDGLQSPLMQEVREKKGLVYYVHSYLSRLNNVGYNMISTMTTEDNVDKIIEIVSLILDNPEKFLTRERFDIVKSNYKVRLEMQEINRYSNINHLISAKGWSVQEIIDDITYEKSLEIAKKYLKFSNFTISRDDQEFK
jgi:predicted Zn-dependent peptidase